MDEAKMRDGIKSYGLGNTIKLLSTMLEEHARERRQSGASRLEVDVTQANAEVARELLGLLVAEAQERPGSPSIKFM